MPRNLSIVWVAVLENHYFRCGLPLFGSGAQAFVFFVQILLENGKNLRKSSPLTGGSRVMKG